MSSMLHLYAAEDLAFNSACFAKTCFSKPLDRSTPSQRYPGQMPNLFGGGAGPLYRGFSEIKARPNSFTFSRTYIIEIFIYCIL